MKLKNIATISFKYPLDLAKQYDLVRLALFHKYLDKYEFQKKENFYYHFTQDLLKELKKQYLNRATLNRLNFYF